jgi:hypothetical protein
LQARIEEQALEGANVEAEITRQQLIAQKADLDVIETGIRALEIQAQIAEAAYRLASIDTKKTELESDIGRINLDVVEVDVRKSQTSADTARLMVQKEEEQLVESELGAARAQTSIYGIGTGLIECKGPLLDQRIAAADTELRTTMPRLAEAIAKEGDADLTAQEARSSHSVSEYDNRAKNYDEKVKTSNAIKALEKLNHGAEAAMINAHADDTANYYSAMTNSANKHNKAVEYAAKKIASADITNTITHAIGPRK